MEGRVRGKVGWEVGLEEVETKLESFLTCTKSSSELSAILKKEKQLEITDCVQRLFVASLWNHRSLARHLLLPPLITTIIMSEFFYPLASYKSPSTPSSSTLILPSISVGSVPQLTTDLLIHSKALGLRKVGRLNSDQCWGFFGEEEREGHDEEEGCTPLEGQ